MITTLPGLLRMWVTDRPKGVALTFEDVTLTFEDLESRSNQLAWALTAAGVHRGDRVAFYGKNRPEFMELLFGATKVGAVPVPVNWRLSPGEAMEIVADAKAKVLIVEQAYLSGVRSVGTNVEVPLCVVIDASTSDSYEAWVGGRSDTDPNLLVRPNDVALQVYTSATTGKSKGAMHTHMSLLSSLCQTAERWGFCTEDVNLVAMPVCHVSGTWWALLGMVNGGCTVLLREAEPAKVLDAVVRHQVTRMMLVPTLLQMLADLPDIENVDLSSLRTLVYGGSPIGGAVLARVIELLDCELIQGYGSTETLPMTELVGSDHDPNRPELLQSCGKEFPWIDLRIGEMHPTKSFMPGVLGELRVRATQISPGYWNNVEATQEAIAADGWFSTGDIGYKDADGYIYLVDRAKDMIVSGGENVYSVEVEGVIKFLAGIEDVAIIGVPDEKWGETIKAVVVVGKGAELSEEDVIKFARHRLAHYKCPTSVDFVTEMPRNLAGKILKRELRMPYWSNHLRQIG